MSDAINHERLAEIRCGRCGGSRFYVDTSIDGGGVLVECRSSACHALETMVEAPSLAAAFEAISRKEAPDAPA